MGVVSNGMLCSGDELRLTGDADGILILPADTPLGVPARRPLRRRRPRRRRQAEPRRRPLPRRPRPRGGGGHRRARCAFPDVAPRRGAGATTAERLAVDRRRPGASARASSGAGSAASAVGPSPGRRPDAPPGGRHAPDQQRRRRHQLRDARAGQADPRLRRRGRRPRRRGRAAHPRPPGRAPASASRRSTTSSASSTPDTLLIADARGPLALAGVMGGATSEVAERDDRGHRRVGHLRPGEHPPDRLPLRPPLARRACASRRARRRASPASAPTAWPSSIVAWAGGRVAAGRVDTAPAEPARPRVAFRPGRVNRLLGTTFTGARAGGAARAGRRSTSRRPPVGARASSVAGGDSPSSWRPAEPALVAIVPTWRRDLHDRGRRRRGDRPRRAATTRCRRRRRTPRCRTSGPTRWSAATRSGGRSSGPGSPRSSRRPSSPSPRPRASAGRSTPRTASPGQDAVAGPPIRVRNPLSERHAVLRVRPRREPPRRRSPSTSATVAATSRSSRSGRATRADADGAPAEWWRLGFLLTGRRRAARRGACPAGPWDLEDAKAIVALVARGARRRGAVVPAAPRRRARSIPGRAARVRRRRASLAGPRRRGPPGDARRLGPPRRAGPRRRARRRRPGRRPAAAAVRVAPLGRHAGASSATSRSSSPRARRPATWRPPCARPAATSSAALTLFDVYRGRPARPAEKSLAWRLALRG